jgi:hypothetical protein
VHRADYDHAKADPQQTWQPSKRLAGENRAGDRSRRSDGREVLRKQIERTSRDEIDAVGVRLRRSLACVVQAKLTRHPASVQPVRTDEQDDERDREDGEIHQR